MHPAADDFMSPLQGLATRARDELAAQGVAIALGQAGEIVCEASAGEAPPVGTRLSTSSTLSSECMRTRKPLCDTGCSVLLAPVLSAETAIGVCVAFSPGKHVPTTEHLERLVAVAQAVAQLRKPSQWDSQPRHATTLSPATLQEVEQAITGFAREEKRRRRVRKARKIAGIALLTCVIGASFVPDRIAAWVTPILHRFERSHQAQNVDIPQRSGR